MDEETLKIVQCGFPIVVGQKERVRGRAVSYCNGVAQSLIVRDNQVICTNGRCRLPKARDQQPGEKKK